MAGVDDLEGANGDAAEEAVEKWFTVRQAAAMLDVTPRRVYALIETGELHSSTDKLGQKRIPREEVLSCSSTTSSEAQKNQNDVIRALRELVKTQLDGQKDYLKLIPDATVQLLQQQAEVIKFQNQVISDLHKENRELRLERSKMLVDVEQALITRDERELAKEKMRREQDRYDQLVVELKTGVPRLAEQLMVGGDVQKLLGSLDPKLLELMCAEDGPLTEEQRVWARSIRERIEARRGKQIPAKTSAEPKSDGDASTPATDTGKGDP